MEVLVLSFCFPLISSSVITAIIRPSALLSAVFHLFFPGLGFNFKTEAQVCKNKIIDMIREICSGLQLL